MNVEYVESEAGNLYILQADPSAVIPERIFYKHVHSVAAFAYGEPGVLGAVS